MVRWKIGYHLVGHYVRGEKRQEEMSSSQDEEDIIKHLTDHEFTVVNQQTDERITSTDELQGWVQDLVQELSSNEDDSPERN